MGPWAQAKAANANAEIEAAAIVLEMFIFPRCFLKTFRYIPALHRAKPISSLRTLLSSGTATPGCAFVAQVARRPGAKAHVKTEAAGDLRLLLCFLPLPDNQPHSPFVMDAAQGDTRCLPRILYEPIRAKIFPVGQFESVGQFEFS